MRPVFDLNVLPSLARKSRWGLIGSGFFTLTFATALLAGVQNLQRPSLQFKTETRTPKIAGVPPLVGPPAGQDPVCYKKLAFTGERQYAQAPLAMVGAGSQTILQRRDKISGEINYVYNSTTDTIAVVNASLAQTGSISDPPPWPSTATVWPEPPVLTVTVPLDDGRAIASSNFSGLLNNPLGLTVKDATHAGDDNIFKSAVGGINGTSAGEFQENFQLELSDADSAAAAEARARVTTVANEQIPDARTSIRGTIIDGPIWTIRKVTVTAFFYSGQTCPGDYELVKTYQWRQIGTETWLPYPEVRENKHLESGHLDLVFDLPLEVGYEVRLADMTVEVKSGNCASGSCGPDGGVAGIGHGPTHGSITWQMPLGLALDGRSAGSLSLFSEHITTALYTPASLKVAVTAGLAAATMDGSGVVRQVLAPQALVDVVTLSSDSFEIRVYASADAGTPDQNGIYTPAGTPYITWRVDRPGSGRWRMTRLIGSQSEVTEVDESQAGTMIFSEANGLRVTETIESTEGPHRVETIVVRNAAGAVASRRKEYFSTYGWGEAKVKEVLDPEGTALTTGWTYDTNPSSMSYRRLTRIDRPDGSHEDLTYFGETGWLAYHDFPIWNEFNNRIFTTRTVADLDGDGVADVRTAESQDQGFGNSSLTHVINWGAPATIGGVKYRLRELRRAITPSAAWNTASNIITSERYYAEGAKEGRLAYRRNPDGTLVLTRYSSGSGGSTVTTEDQGAGDGSGEAVADGTRTVTISNDRGFLVSRIITDIATSRMLDSEVVGQSDAFGRPTHLMHLDGAEEVRSYCLSCGAVEQVTLRGETVSYEFDALGRKLLESHRAGTTTLTKNRFEYDADGRLRKTYRVSPTDNTETLLASTDYDLAGRVVSEYSLQSGTIAHNYAFAAGHTTVTTITYADGSTRIESRGAGGDLLKVAGTAVAPVEYSWDSHSGGGYTAVERRFFDASTLLDIRTGINLLGGVADVTRSGGAVARRFFDSVGRVNREVDPDGVTRLYDYDARGRQAVAAVDMDGNNTIDYTGTDRITRTLAEVAVHEGLTVQRSTTQVWETDGADTPVTVSISEQSVDGLHSWQTVRGLTTATVTVYDDNGGHTVTTTAPDGVVTTQTYFGDRLTGTTVKDASAVQIAAVSNDYDDLGRLHTVTDARNGTTTYAYDASDRLHTVTTPDPDATRSGPGYDPQVTAYDYDSLGRITTVTQPDSGVVNTTYWPTGAVKRTWGSRIYPVEYAYDLQQRVQTMTTWQDFAGDSGRAVTTWNYDERGWLGNKRYANDTGPNYQHKLSGRLSRRIWARGVQAIYTYNAAGDLAGTTYTDSTPAVSIDYDRAGRPQSIADGSGTRTLAYHASGQLQDETYTTGLLNGHSVGRTFDSLSRLGSVSARSASSVLNQTGYSYDSASRLGTVTQATNTATYGYVANSPLIGAIAFQQGGNTRLTTTKSYDNLDRLSAISNQLSALNSQLSTAYDYNSANQRIKAIPEDSAHWDYSYDSLGQVTSGKKFTSASTGLPGHDFAWTYDDIGNRKTAVANGQTSTYTPNNLNQYASRTIPGAFDVLAAAEPAATVTYQFPWDTGVPTTLSRFGDLLYKQLTADNSNGNINAKIRVTGAKNLIGANGEDAVTQITTSTYLPQTPLTYGYDPDGNLTGDGHWTYTWDGENRLIAMQTTTPAVNAGAARQKLEFGYDAQGRRFSKKVSNWDGGGWALASSTLFLYDVWNLLANLNTLNSNAVTCTYAWGLDLSGSMQGAGGVGGLLFAGITTPSASIHATCYDGNGNVIAYVDMATGAKSATYEYSAFGETLIADGVAAESMPFRFSTKYTDSETGLLYYGLRYYSPSLGRFINKDPIGEKGGKNLYAFVTNNAINNYDVLGQYVGLDDAALLVGGAIGGIISWGVEGALPGGHWTGNGFVASAAGGAVGAWATEYGTPIVGLAAGAATKDFVEQGLDKGFGNVDYSDVIVNTVSGVVVGKVAEGLVEHVHIEIPGVTSGKGSFSAVAKRLRTQLKSGKIQRISLKSAGKIAAVGGIDRTVTGGFEGGMMGFVHSISEGQDSETSGGSVTSTGDLGTTWWGTDASGNKTRVTAGPMESSTDSAPAPGNAGNGDGGNAGGDGGSAGGDGGSAGGGGSGGTPEDPYKDPPKVQPE